MRARARLLAPVLCVIFAGGGIVRAEEPAAGAPAATEQTEASPSKAELEDKAAAAKRLAEEYELQRLFADTLDQVERNYVKNISRRELMEAAIHGLLSKLDQYSDYISPDDLGQFKTSVENQFGGIGIRIDHREGRVKVVSPLIGSPAYRAGIHAGDEIIEIEGKSVDDLRNTDEVVANLKGEPGTKVTITTYRPSTKDRKTLTLEREVVHLETVMGDRRKPDDSWDFMLDRQRKIGYIRVTGFSRDTEHDLVGALDQLKKENMRGLVLDLRFNPGGLLTSAIAVADLFIAKGKIVSTEGRNTKSRSWDAQEEGTYEGFPIAVLVNRYSASASEIVSACLQDHHRAVVIGERTWGKGSVQNVIELEGGKSALKLTTASYQRPSGKNIHRFPNAKESDEWGVSPDPGYDLKLDEAELLQLSMERHDRDVVAAETPAAETEDAKPAAEVAKSSGGKAEFVDRQLQKAIDYLSGEMAKAN